MYWPNKAQTPNGGKTAIKEETLKTVAEDEVARVHSCTKGVPSLGVGCGDHSHFSSRCKMTDPYVNWKLPTFIEENIMNIYILNISPHVWSRTCICSQLSVSSKVSYHSLGQFYPHNLFFFVLWRNGGVKYDFNWLDCISNCARSGSRVKKNMATLNHKLYVAFNSGHILYLCAFHHICKSSGEGEFSTHHFKLTLRWVLLPNWTFGKESICS